MIDRSRRRIVLAAAAAGFGFTGAVALRPALAQSTYPDRPITLVVPYPPGGLTDALGRLLGEQMRPALGQPWVVENRPGAGTLRGAAQVAKAAADGYTLLVATSTTLAISPAMFASPPATAADFTGVAMIGSVNLFLVTRPDLDVKSLADLVTLLRRNPDRYSFASPGNGTMHHLIVEMIKKQEKVSATHVPYQGSVTALTDLMGGRIDFMFIDAVVGLPQVAAGKVKAIAVAAPKRSAQQPDVPTVAETYPSIDLQAWQSIAAPRGTPAAIVAKLNAEINRQLDTADMKAALRKVGVEANPMSPQALNDFIDADAKRFADLVKSAGVKAN